MAAARDVGSRPEGHRDRGDAVRARALARLLRRPRAAAPRPAVQPQRPHPLLLGPARGATSLRGDARNASARGPLPLTLLSQYLPGSYERDPRGPALRNNGGRPCCRKASRACCAQLQRRRPTPGARRGTAQAAGEGAAMTTTIESTSPCSWSNAAAPGRRARSPSSPAVWADGDCSPRAGAQRRRRLASRRQLATPQLRVVFTGAGTSAFIGESLAPAIARHCGARVDAVPPTDLVAGPGALRSSATSPTLLVLVRALGQQPRERRGARARRPVRRRLPPPRPHLQPGGGARRASAPRRAPDATPPGAARSRPTTAASR